MSLSITLDESSTIIEEMLEHFGLNTLDELAEMSLADLYTVLMADINNGHLIVTPDGGAPRPIPLNEFFRRPPLRVVK